MTYLQRAILAISIALIILLATLTLRSVYKQVDKVPAVNATLLFDPSSAYEMTEELTTGHPRRAMGTDESKASAEWIAAKMAGFHLKTDMQEFTGWIQGKPVTGRNVIGIDYGVRENVIVLLAHYDIPFHVLEGAMDDASGVGVLLELARVFSKEEQEKTLVFIASDGEEWGMLGARHFVDSYPDIKRIFAAVSLDYVRVEDPEEIYLRGDGQFRGYSPLWLWLLSEDCIETAGGTPESPSPMMHYLAQAIDISSTDQGPFVAAGIPAVNLGGNKSDSPLARDIYHTEKDTKENLKPELFATFGKAAEELVRSLDVLDYTPENEHYFLPFENRRFIGHVPLLTLQFALFFPLLLATAFQYYNLREYEDFVRVVSAEVVNFGLFFLPWVCSLLMLYTLAWTNYIPRYELYPATPLDPFLYRPLWGAIAGTGAVFIIGWIIVFLVRRLFPSFRKPGFPVSKAIGLDILLTSAIVALLCNGFAASLFLGPAALLWIWLERGRAPIRLSLNLLLTISAVIPLVLVLVYFSGNLKLGWYVLWYVFLGVAYRFFSPITVLIAVVAVTIGGRLFQQSLNARKHLMKPETKKDELLESRA